MEFKCSNLTITLKDGKVIVKNLSFLLNKGDKIALIGEEGNGKSTIIKCLVDPSLISDYCYYQGNISIIDYKIGYLKQSLEAYYDVNCLSYLFMDEKTQKIDLENNHKLYIIKKLFNDFNLNLDILERKISTLSGGEKVKLQLVKIEFIEAGLLIFDEPTNDIDLRTLIELEDYVKKTNKPIVFVSHDSEFLAATANMILHLEQIKRKTEVKHTLFKGSYQDYLEDRNIGFEKQNAKAYQEDKTIKAKKKVLKKFKSKLEHHMLLACRQPTWGRLLAKKMKVVKGQERKLELQEKNKTEYVSVESAINLAFEDDVKSIPNGKMVLELKDYTLNLKNGSKIENINLTIKGKEHICIIGNNGVGKTTFIKEIMNKINQTSNLSLGYFPQDYQEILDYNQEVVSFLLNNHEASYEFKTKVMTYLSAANFLEYELVAKIKDLSQGQKAKVLLIKLILDRVNVLILDEPTRNMSSLSAPIMEKILADFEGAIVAISHDRSFIKNVCDKVYELTPKGLELINSNGEFDS